jgi:hypothetical protein
VLAAAFVPSPPLLVPALVGAGARSGRSLSVRTAPPAAGVLLAGGSTTEDKVAEDGVAGDRVSEDKVAEGRVVEDRFAEDRVAEGRAFQDPAFQDPASQDSVTQDRVTQDRVTQDRVTQDRVTQDRVTQDRVTQDRATQDQATQDSAGMMTGTGEPVTALTGPLLAACEQAVSGLVTAAPQTIVVVGAGARSWRHAPEEWGTLAGFGVAVEAPSVHPDTPAALPLSLTIARWLLERVGWTGRLIVQEVCATASVTDCLELGHSLDQQAGPEAAWLVVGDGSNRRGVRSPGFEDPRAAGFDAEVGKALAGVDREALAALDPGLAAELGCVGRAPWQVVAGALDQAGPATATVRYEGAPFGVAYFVADWRFRA